MNLPITMRRTLHHIMAISQTIEQFLKKGDLKSANTKFTQIRGLLREIDDDAVEGHARFVWNDLRMLLSNDAFEGSKAPRLPDANRVLAGLQQTLRRVDRQFGLSHGDSGPKQYDVSPKFQNQLANLWKAYTGISESLAADNPKAAAERTAEFQTVLAQVDMKLLTDQDAHMAWMRELGKLKGSIAELSRAKDLKTQRVHFKSLSAPMQTLALSFGFGSDNPVYKLHCRMAFSNKGAFWLQTDSKTRNPYFGIGDAMYRCADPPQLIAGKEEPKPNKKSKHVHPK
jgi:hypothetical protein